MPLEADEKNPLERLLERGVKRAFPGMTKDDGAGLRRWEFYLGGVRILPAVLPAAREDAALSLWPPGGKDIALY